MAKRADVPIVVAYIDYKKKEMGFKGVIEDISNMNETISKISEMYKNVNAKYPNDFVLDKRYSKKKLTQTDYKTIMEWQMFGDPTLAIADDSLAPEKPDAPDGPASGGAGVEYTYTASTTDPDGDKIYYLFDWGDGKKNTTEFLPNGAAAYQIHSWSVAGKYAIKVTASDNKTISKTKELIMLIDVHIVDGIGYLIDSDSNGIYDFFHNDTSGIETEVEKQDNGTYLLDDNGDDSWDYIYDPDTDTLTKYSESEAGNTALYILIFGLFLVILILLIVYFASGKKEEQ